MKNIYLLLILMSLSSLQAQTLTFAPLFHTCAIDIELPAGFDSDQNASCELEYRAVGSSTWLKAYMPDRMLNQPTESFRVSLFGLEPSRVYEVRGEVIDSLPTVQRLNIPAQTFLTPVEPVVRPTPNVKWVAPNGSGTDYSEQSPGDLKTLLQAGLLCGTTVYLMDGVYETGDLRLNINQTCSERTHIVIMAAPGARPVLDGGYYTALNWAQSQNDSTLFSANLPAVASYTNLCLLDSVRLFPYATLGNNIFSGNYHLGSLSYGFDGFVRNNSAIWLKITKGTDPRQSSLVLSQYFRGLTINGFQQDNYLRIKGIIFRHYGKSSVGINGVFGAIGLRLVGTHRVLIDSCEFLYNDAPLVLEGSCQDVTIQRCHFKDNTGKWSHAMFKKSVSNQNVLYPTSLGRSLENTAILYKAGSARNNNLVIRDNLIDGFTNGIAASAGTDGIYNADVHDNKVINCFDGLECDGYWSNLKIWNNDVSGMLAGVSFAPPYHGPVYVYRNTFHHIISRKNTSDDPHHVGCQPPASYFSAGIGIKTNSGAAALNGAHLHFINNTFHSKDSLGYVMYSWNDEWEKATFINNIYYAEGSPAFFFNGMKNDSSYRFHSLNDNYFVKNSPSLAIIKEVHGQYQCHEVQDADSLQAKHQAISKSSLFQVDQPLQADPLFIDPMTDDFSLQVASPMIDAGLLVDGFYDYQGPAPDVGAIESDSLGGGMNLEESASMTISVYPNPTDGELWISSAHRILAVDIFDLKGERLGKIEELSNQEARLDIGKWKGLLLLVIRTDAGHAIKKIWVN